MIVSANADHTVPEAIAKASYKKQKRNGGITEITGFEGRWHSLVVDHGWKDVGDRSLAFVKRFV